MKMKSMKMYEIHSHCSYCGAAFPTEAPWPRGCAGCGNRSYLNPLPVVVLLVPVGDGLVVIRRNVEPGKGELALPGGYLDLGESWQEGGRREILEETGIALQGEIQLYDVMNGLDGTLIIFGLAEPQPEPCVAPFCSEETQEVQLIHQPVELAFEMHTLVVKRFFANP